MAEKTKNGVLVVARNRRARHDYIIEEVFEAGMVLVGTEVKSLRNGTCSLAEAFVRPRGDELYLVEMNIPPYAQGNIMNHEEKRPRKLLLHRREMNRLLARVAQRGLTIVPLSVYFKDGFAKVEIAVVTRRKKWDKRDKKEQKQFRRDARQDLGRRRQERRHK